MGLFNIHVLPKHMAGIKFGSTVSLLFNALFWFPYYVIKKFCEFSLKFHQVVEIDKDIESIVLFVGCMYISLCGIIVLGHHYPRLPNTKHATKGTYIHILHCLNILLGWDFLTKYGYFLNEVVLNKFPNGKVLSLIWDLSLFLVYF